MAEEIIKQFLTVQNFDNWTDTKKSEVSEKGQIVFVPGEKRSDKVVDVNAIYADGNTFGDGALSNKTVLTESITVAGGPLSDLLIDKGITELESGTNLQELLKTLFCVELWSKNVSVTNPKVTVSNVAPKITGVSSTTLYEVGTVLDITIALQQMGVSNTAAKISGFEYGSYYGNSKHKDVNERVQTNEIVYENAPYYGSFSYSSDSSGSMSSAVNFQSIATNGLAVSGGTQTVKATTYLGSINKVTAASSQSKSLTYTNDGISKTHDLNNLGDISKNSYSVNAVNDYNVGRDETAKTTTITWTGVYPIYFEGTKYSGTIPSDNVAIGEYKKCDVLKKDGETLKIYVKFPDQSAAEGWRIVIPQVYSNNGTTITALAFNPLSNKYEASKTFEKTNETKTCTCGTGGSAEYNGVIYLCKGFDGANGVELSIKL